jgi:hypothetical protein
MWHPNGKQQLLGVVHSMNIIILWVGCYAATAGLYDGIACRAAATAAAHANGDAYGVGCVLTPLCDFLAPAAVKLRCKIVLGLQRALSCKFWVAAWRLCCGGYSRQYSSTTAPTPPPSVLHFCLCSVC